MILHYMTDWINQLDQDDLTPLHRATSLDEVKRLHTAGAILLNSHVEYHLERPDVVEYLLSHGLNPDVTSIS